MIQEARSTYENWVHEQLVNQKIASRNFWRIYRSFNSSEKSSFLPLFNGAEVITSSVDKAELFAKLFCENSSLEDSNQDMPDFPARTVSLLSGIKSLLIKFLLLQPLRTHQKLLVLMVFLLLSCRNALLR